MGKAFPVFGPDTSTSLLPNPCILGYYAVFFFFGALYFDADDRDGRLGRRWWISLPFALFILFPLGLEFTLGAFKMLTPVVSVSMHRGLSVLLQTLYAWIMTMGLIGLFRAVCSRERFSIRYLSDASYWLYLAHLPLVIALQWALRDLPLPAGVKFTLVGAVTCGVLLAIYQTMVRYTWLGRLLNGPRQRREPRGPL